MAAVSLGVTIVSKDAKGWPRLVRAVIPRAGKTGATAEQAARDHVTALQPLYMSNKRHATDLVATGTQKLRNGGSIVRLQQKVDNIDVHQGELRVMVQSDGSLAAVAGTLQPTSGRATFRSSAKAALERALDDLYGKTRSRPRITEGALRNGYIELAVAADPKVAVRTARAKQELFPDGDKLSPIWNVEVFGQKPGFDGMEPTGHRYLIGDGDGRIVKNANLIQKDAFVYRVFADQTGNRRPFDGAMKSFNPHPAGVPDGSLPKFASTNLSTIDSFNANHDPWLPANATTTSGNNVDAFADIAAPSGFSEGDIRPEVQGGRTLNYKYDTSLEPLANATQSKAAVVNAFFITNFLHDWWYDSGFTEATGNGQLDNFGRGGIAGDPLILHSQDDALGGSRDNAFMVTPADGLSPEMHMFLWSGGSQSNLEAPTGAPQTAVFRTGPKTFDLSGTAALADNVDGTGAVVHDACTPVTTDLTGKIAMFEFTGACGSVTAVDNVKAAGAIGAIASIAIAGVPVQDLNGSAAANIPGLVIGFEDGAALEATLPANVSLHRTTHIENDGDLDNAVVAHEWGHYLHHRLAVCEFGNQCAGMSEGWGDFNALLMMLRTGDDPKGTFGMGLYALTAGGLSSFGFNDPGYFGIRRFAYSTNRAANALSFRHIGDENALPDVPTNPGPAGGPNSEVHNAGEVWAAMMWEAYNALIDEHGILQSRRRISDYVVAGLLLTPPDATFTEGRDAILAAAGALDTDDMILMAAAFAGRGAGSCAVSPDRQSFDNAGVVESGTLAAKLETSAVTLTDDGASCDNDGFLDPGESGTLHVTIANSGVLPAERVKIKAKTTTDGVKVGKTIAVGNVAPFSSVDLAIPVTLDDNAPTNSTLDITVTVTGDAGCDTGSLAVELHQRMGIDEAADVETTDHVETTITPWQRAGEGGGDTWNIAADDTGNHAWFGVDNGFTSDTQLLSPVLQASMTEPLVVTMSHSFNLEAFAPDFFFDGGVVEVSTDGGVSFRDVTDFGVDPGYNGVISSDFDNPLLGRPAYSSTNVSFPGKENVVMNFGTQFAGQAVQLRFRIGTDFCCTAEGWSIDDISATGIDNTPFPGIIPEPDVCNALAPSGSSGVSGTKTGPHQILKRVAPGDDE